MTMDTYTFTMKDDKPYPYTTFIKDGNGKTYKPDSLNKIPIRVIEFMGLVKENSEIIRITGIRNNLSLFIRLMAHGNDYGDINCKAKGDSKECVVTVQYEKPLLRFLKQFARYWKRGRKK